MPKWMKFGAVFAAFGILLLYTSLGSAQAPPDEVINPILNDLGQRVGRQITIDDLVNYSWSSGIFNNEGIGCPSPDITYTRSFVQGYIVTIYYGNLYWDYRYDAGKGSFFLCNNPNLDNLRLPVTATPTSPPTATPLPTQAGQQALPQATSNVVPPLQQTVQAAPQNTTSGPISVETTLPCPDALTGNVPSRLAVGLTGQFIGSSNQNIHAEPNRTSDVLGVSTVGNTFSILDGPECDRTFTWWQVDTAGVIGWVGEVNPTDLSYWLEPTGGTPVVSANVTPAEPPANNTPSAISLEAPTIEELARQDITSPEIIIARATGANPEGAVFIGGETGLVLYSNTAPTNPIAQIYELPILDFAISKDGNGIIAIVDENGTPALRFASTAGEPIGEAPLTANYVRGMVLIDDLNLLALGGENAVFLYDLGSDQVVAELPLNNLPLQMALSPINNTLAILLPNEVLLMDVNTRSELGRFAVAAGENAPYGLAFSPDGTRLAIGEGGSANIYNATTFESNLALPVFFDTSGEVDYIVFSSDGQRVATAGNLVTPVQGGSTRLMLWDAQTGNLVAVMSGVITDQQIRGLAFSPSGDLLNAISRENIWQIWSVLP